jgi:hypothetical protein
MSSDAYESSSRHQDVISDHSVFRRTFSPRDFDVSEISDLSSSLLAIESLISILAQFTDTHSNSCPARGGVSHTTGSSGSTVNTTTVSDSDSTCYYFIKSDPGKTIQLGLLTIKDASLGSYYSTVLPKDYTAYSLAGVHTFELMYDGATICAMNMNSYQVAAFLRNLPAELYRTIGSLLEQLAIGFYKGGADTRYITPLERATFVRLQDKICKQAVELAANAKVIGPYGDLMGPDAFKGQLYARDNALNIIRIASPVVYNWLFLEQPLGKPMIVTSKNA